MPIQKGQHDNEQMEMDMEMNMEMDLDMESEQESDSIPTSLSAAVGLKGEEENPKTKNGRVGFEIPESLKPLLQADPTLAREYADVTRRLGVDPFNKQGQQLAPGQQQIGIAPMAQTMPGMMAMP